MHVVYLGLSGFPYGLAAIERQLLLSKTLIHGGAEVTIINNKGTHSEILYPELKAEGKFEDINYVYTSGSPFRNFNFLKRNILKFFRFYFELKYLIKLNKKKKINYGIVSNRNILSEIIFYFIVSRILRFKIVLNFVELYSNADTDRKSSFRRNLNDILFNKYSYLFLDGYITISQYLTDIVCKNYHKKFIKIPVLVDLERFNDVKPNQNEKYFLFCGAADYFEVIKLIIDAYNFVSSYNFKLYLVLNGNKKNYDTIKQYIYEKNLSNKVILFSKLSRVELVEFYKNATTLLIPLKNSLQDKARFPHKIGEYLASGNPVITTGFGEIQYYLSDGINALISKDFSITCYSASMKKSCELPYDQLKKIGLNGYNVAREFFDYKIYSSSLNNFLIDL